MHNTPGARSSRFAYALKKEKLKVGRKMLDKQALFYYNNSAVSAAVQFHGGIAQLVEHPVHTRVVICSNQIAATRPVGQVVKTPPFHGGNMGSNPVRVTKKKAHLPVCLFLSSDKESLLSRGESGGSLTV